jgi:hypothetical protein
MAISPLYSFIREVHMGGNVLTIARSMGVVLAALVVVQGSLAAQVRPLNLREMVASAGTIFIGTVGSVRGATDEHGDIVTYTTFTVEESIYGVAAKSVTVKQFGGEAAGMSARLEHMRYFRTGERVLVMFYPVSSIGFTSPIGLGQAVWTVTPGGLVTGVSGDAVSGLGAMLKSRGATMNGSGSIGRAAFVAVIGDLLREVGKR